MATGSFSYSNEEGQNIIVPDTLFDQTCAQTDDVKMFLDFKKSAEKELKLSLHMTSLSDYWREKMIPRGLRIKKFPSFGFPDMEFKHKWEAILNKCSLDLMLLLIEEAKKQRCESQKEMEELKAEMSSKFADKEPTFEKDLKEGLDKLQKEIKQEKLEKFKRDQQDYKEERVYTWKQKHGRSTLPQRRRTVSFRLPSSDDEHSDHRTSTAFLDKRHKKDNKKHQKQSARPDEEDDDRRERYTRSKGKKK